MDELFIQKSALALVLGFMIGLQREMHAIYTQKSSDFAGSRTFSMISLMGFLGIWINDKVPYVFGMMCGLLGLVLIVGYVVNNLQAQEKGTTTEFAAILTFFIGAMLHIAPVMLGVFLAVTLLFVLNIKEKIQEYEKTLSKGDLNAAILFLMMSLVILPILPDATVDPYGLVNLYRIWLMVVLVAGISFFGYVVMHLMGTSHGLSLAGLLGGIVSSTAVTLSFARHSVTMPSVSKNFAVGICLASTVMLIRVIVEVWIVNPSLVLRLVPAVFLGLVAGGVVLGMMMKDLDRQNLQQELIFKNPFDLKEALLMGIIFGVILALIELSDRYVGDSGVYIVSMISGVSDIDAIILSLSSMAKNGLHPTTAVYGMVIAVVVNTIVKSAIIFGVGDRQTFRLVTIFHTICVGVFALVAFVTPFIWTVSS